MKMTQPNQVPKATGLAAVLCAAVLTVAGCGGGSDGASNAGPGVFDGQLAFNGSKYTTINVALDGVSTPVRWYREVCYVGKPMKLAATQPVLLLGEHHDRASLGGLVGEARKQRDLGELLARDPRRGDEV